MGFHEEAFEAAAKIAAAVAEEAEVELSAKGAEQVSEFFAVLYKRLRAVAEEEETARPGTFEVYQDKNEEFRFRLKAGNNEVIAVSEGYKSKAACLKGIESVKRNAAAEVVEE